MQSQVIVDKDSDKMAIKLSKEEATSKINLRKDVLVDITKKNPVLSNLRSRVALVLDYSLSMEDSYLNGSIQELLERIIPLALKFDDDGSLDTWIFDDGFHRVGEVTIDNFYGYINNKILSKYNMGCTQYSPVMNDVYKKYIIEEPVTYPSYVLFITDGDCSDKAKTFETISKLSEYPIFWQFIGIGNSRFNTLEELDDFDNRLVDNADFFKVQNIESMSDEELYNKLMTEYPDYLEYPEIKNKIKGEKRVMAVNLSKGSKISLAKVAEDAGIHGGLKNIVVGLGWDTNRYSGGAQFDLDAAAFLTSNGKVRSEADFVFYNTEHKTAEGYRSDLAESVMHTGDNRTGEGDGDDEQILVDLTKVPADVDKISFTVTIDQADVHNQNFGMVENSMIHILDKDTGTELIRYDLGEDFSVETAIVAAELYRNNGEWKFNAVGAGFSGGLAALCGNFGIDV